MVRLGGLLMVPWAEAVPGATASTRSVGAARVAAASALRLICMQITLEHEKPRNIGVKPPLRLT